MIYLLDGVFFKYIGLNSIFEKSVYFILEK